MALIGSLCTGYGGLDLAVESVFGASPAWFAEFDPAPSRILAHHWPAVPNLRDLTTTDWAAVEPVEILTAGYPCQPFSQAGNRKGTEDARHLWPYIANAVGLLRPRIVVLENVAGHLSLGMAAVVGDLAALGYDTRWGIVRASDAGAPHLRARVFIVASDADGQRYGSREDAAGLGRMDSGDAAAPRQRQRTRPITGDRNPAATADPGSQRLHRAGTGNAAPSPSGRGSGAAGSSPAAADPAGLGWGQGRPEPAGILGGSDAAERGYAAASDPDRPGPQGSEPAGGFDLSAWGPYAAAVSRWEVLSGRPAPRPTEPGRNGERLSPAFVEWMMGLPAGWVTDPAIGLTRNQQLKALGNGVVPAEARLALQLLGAADLAADLERLSNEPAA